MTLYLYDPLYNIKKETTYKKIDNILGISINYACSYKNKKIKLDKKYYLIDENTTIKQIREFYYKQVIKNEVWKEVEGSDGTFLISDHGRFKRIFKSNPNGKFILPYYITRKVNVNKNKAFIKVKFKGIYKEYTVARLVAYHYVDIFYECDNVTKKGKAIKYKNYNYDDVVAYHKNGIVYDNYAGNLEWLDREDMAKKTASKSRSKGTIVAKDATTGEIIDYYKSTRDAAKHLFCSKTSVSDSLNEKWKTNIVAGTYIFEYED